MNRNLGRVKLTRGSFGMIKASGVLRFEIIKNIFHSLYDTCKRAFEPSLQFCNNHQVTLTDVANRIQFINPRAHNEMHFK